VRPIHHTLQACLTADEDFPAFILNTFRSRYKASRQGQWCWGQGSALAQPMPHICSLQPCSDLFCARLMLLMY
jgi:hypothetical protein